MQIIVAFLRMQIVMNKKFIKLPDYKITSVILLIISAIYFLPYAFTQTIIRNEIIGDNGTISYSYKATNNDLGNSSIGKYLIIITTIIRGYICAAIIIAINVITKIKMTSHMNKKKKVKGGGQSVAAVAKISN